VDAIDQTPLIHHLSGIQSELLLLDMRWTRLQLVGNKISKVHLQQQPAKKAIRWKKIMLVSAAN
jgi:hypothetical protein